MFFFFFFFFFLLLLFLLFIFFLGLSWFHVSEWWCQKLLPICLTHLQGWILAQSSRIYRLTLQEEASYTSVVKLVADCCPDVAQFLAKGGACPLKYADDEGDWCTLAQATFDDFMSLQSNKRLLKLRLKSREPEPPQEPETPEAKAASAKEEVPPAGPPPGLENEKDELGEARLGIFDIVSTCSYSSSTYASHRISCHKRRMTIILH